MGFVGGIKSIIRKAAEKAQISLGPKAGVVADTAGDIAFGTVKGVVGIAGGVASGVSTAGKGAISLGKTAGKGIVSLGKAAGRGVVTAGRAVGQWYDEAESKPSKTYNNRKHDAKSLELMFLVRDMRSKALKLYVFLVEAFMKDAKNVEAAKAAATEAWMEIMSLVYRYVMKHARASLTINAGAYNQHNSKARRIIGEYVRLQQKANANGNLNFKLDIDDFIGKDQATIERDVRVREGTTLRSALNSVKRQAQQQQQQHQQQQQPSPYARSNSFSLDTTGHSHNQYGRRGINPHNPQNPHNPYGYERINTLGTFSKRGNRGHADFFTGETFTGEGFEGYQDMRKVARTKATKRSKLAFNGQRFKPFDGEGFEGFTSEGFMSKNSMPMRSASKR